MVPRLYSYVILHFDLDGESWIEKYKPPPGELYTQRQISSMLTNISKDLERDGKVKFTVLGKGIYKFESIED